MWSEQNKKRGIKILVGLLILGAGAFAFAKIYPYYTNPCGQPIKYSIGEFDAQFNISQADFLADVAQAAAIWGTPLNRQFFEYSPADAQLQINLVYDTRQRATDQLQKLGYTIQNTQSSYDSLKSHYDSLMAQYTAQKTALDAASAEFDTAKAAYEKQVTYWNSQGGAPKDQVTSLNAEYAALIAQATSLNNEKDTVNSLVDQINPLASVLNNLASQLKLNVTTYNTIGQSRGEEFEEGVYVQDSTGRHIDIYEFNDQKELIRLLAHELGHSLGLQHVTDPTAIMYPLMDETQNNVASAADLNELRQVCQIKS